MYCHHCNKKQLDDAIYCSYCARPLKPIDSLQQEDSAQMELAAGSAAPIAEQSEEKATSIWLWLTPILAGFVVIASLGVYYSYEFNINNKVEVLHKRAQTEALEGNYEAASDTLEEALKLRPSHTALQADVAIVAMAAKLEHAIDSAAKLLDEQDAAGAEKGLESVADNLNNRNEAIFNGIREQLVTQQDRLKALQLVGGLEELETVSDLVYALTTISGLSGEEAEAARRGVIDKIVAITDESAKQLLEKKKFNDAIAEVNKGLEYDKDNEQLLDLLDEIKTAKLQYERNEQQRLEQAMQQAAAEELKNQTAAVEVVKMETMLGEEGTLLIQGELKNAATRPIYNVSIEYSVKNAAGQTIGTGMAEATPEYVESGESMYVYGELPDVYEDQTTVVIDNVVWYLD